ncbi:RbsD/FucU family protein [Bacillus sp. FJAT-22090]|uniref:RbsD/FucU family protein n=1 Tax=Bacillus sp. FJAT-22090 TaxID=1581038 RepID=UPI00119ECBE2|nr:RbsD/FucU domain-containing protein [Bacillus sp. FJAT-22090]
MLKNIPKCLSPDLLKVLMEMGHGDEIVLADGNFPAASHARNLIRLDGLSIPEVLEAILTLMPLDTYADSSVFYMMHGSEVDTPPIWAEYNDIQIKTGNNNVVPTKVERFKFYEQAKQAYAIIATSEQALYANIILKKGVIT